MKSMEEEICKLSGWSFSVYESFWEVDPRFQGISSIIISKNESKELEGYLRRLWLSGKDYVSSPPLSPYVDKKTGALISFMAENEGPMSIDTNNGVYFSLRVIPDDTFLIALGDHHERRLTSTQFRELCNTLDEVLLKKGTEIKRSK